MSLKPLKQWKYAAILGSVAVVAGVMNSLVGPGWAQSGASGGAAPAEPVISGNLPLEVANMQPTPLETRPAMDQYSWQSFIALNWPANPSVRGTPLDPDNPDMFTSPPKGSETVWESYKASFQLFGTGDAAPEPWSSNTVTGSPCSSSSGKKVLHMVAKGADVLDEVNEAFSYPLIDQNNNYVYSEVRFNEAYYTFVVNGGYYLKRNLPSPDQDPLMMPVTTASPPAIGAIMMKASWRIMTPADDLSRYHVIDAVVLNPDTGVCDEMQMGLVGLHISQKVQNFNAWIWSSFEQVDNIERGPGATASTPISFNNGTDTPATVGGWANRPPKVPPLLPRDKRTPVQVTRLNPIPTTPEGHSTVDINAQYQALLAGTPWASYQLIITQWPTDNDSFKTMQNGGIYPKDSGQPFPVHGATNAAMETFMQSQTDAAGAGGNSCMQCHYGAAVNDYSWFLQNKSH